MTAELAKLLKTDPGACALELRFLCWIEKDDEGYAHAVEAHRLAWDQAGWKGRAWWKEPVDSTKSHDIIE
jgi:hypothetical protein